MRTSSSEPALPRKVFFIVSLLGVVGSGIYLIRAVAGAVALFGDPAVPEATFVAESVFISLTLLAGVLGLIALLRIRSNLLYAALGLGLSGLTGIFVDATLGGPPPPILPALLILGAAAIVYAARIRPASGTAGSESRILPRSSLTALDWIFVILGFVVHAVVAVLFIAFALVAPAWGLLVVYGVWAGFLFAAVRLSRTRPRLVPVVPLISLFVMYALLILGDSIFDWSRNV